jgi:hypothetical protein
MTCTIILGKGCENKLVFKATHLFVAVIAWLCLRRVARVHYLYSDNAIEATMRARTIKVIGFLDFTAHLSIRMRSTAASIQYLARFELTLSILRNDCVPRRGSAR